MDNESSAMDSNVQEESSNFHADTSHIGLSRTAEEVNESLLDNFEHMQILTPRVYKSTPPKSNTPHTPPHTPPSIPLEISAYSPVTPSSPSGAPRILIYFNRSF